MKFTKREEEVADHIVKGHSRKRIAEEMGISPGVASNYMHSVYEKSGIRGKVPFANWWRKKKAENDEQ